MNSPNRVELLPDPKEDQVSEVASRLGLRPVGWIFTDLVAADLSKGTVKNFRGNIVCILLFSCLLISMENLKLYHKCADFNGKFKVAS